MTNEQKLAVCENIELAIENLKTKIMDEHDYYFISGMLCVMELLGLTATVDLKRGSVVKIREDNNDKNRR